jgi:oleate hydratase
VAQDCRAGSVLRPSRQVLQRSGAEQLDESATVTTLDDRFRRTSRRSASAIPSPARSSPAASSRQGFQLASELDGQPPAAVPQPAQGSADLIWVYGLFTDKPGDFREEAHARLHRRKSAWSGCTTWACPRIEIEELATKSSANTVPCMMPYITAFFMPREEGDRPDVVPEGSVNFAFLGQFAETKRDTIFTTEYSIRTGMEAVYTC